MTDNAYLVGLRLAGKKVVVVGGGTGLSTLLRGLKTYSANITAIVTVADDGGSSGRLRREIGVLPPGDIRNCLAALADEEKLLTELFQYRFQAGDGLAGHPPNAPYDRVVVTCTVRTWGSLLEQCPNGRVVAPWGSSFFAASFATLDVRDGVGCGRSTKPRPVDW